MKTKILTTIWISPALAFTAHAERPTIEQLESTVNDMPKTIKDLQQQISDLKQQQQMAPPTTTAPAMVTTQTMTLSPNTIVFSQTVTQSIAQRSVRWTNGGCRSERGERGDRQHEPVLGFTITYAISNVVLTVWAQSLSHWCIE